MMAQLLGSFVYQHHEPSSAVDIVVKAMSLVTLLFMAYLGISEATGKHLHYSKFWNVNSNGAAKLSSKTGMLLLYTPACIASLVSFLLFPDVDGGISSWRFLMLRSALTIHFSKRGLEVLLVHKFSGGMTFRSAIIISAAYLVSATSMIYVQYLYLGSAEPWIDLEYVGLLVFLVGICGNFYHHYLLSKLRAKNEKGYKIPQGGLFSLVLCPHYLFEILIFTGISFISQTLHSFTAAMGVALYLLGRSYATRKWYLSKFEDFPRNVKALIPYVF